MYGCEICSKTFSRRDNMLRHKKRMHETTDFDSPKPKRRKMDEDTDSEDIFLSEAESETEGEGTEQSADDSFTDADPWQAIIDKTFAKCQSEFDEKVKSYQERHGVDANVAREKVYREMRPIYRKKMAELFIDTALWLRSFLSDPVFISIKNTAADLQDMEDYGGEESWKYAVKKRQFLFDKKLGEYYAPEIIKPAIQPTEPTEQKGGGGLKPWLSAPGENPVHVVENWAKNESQRIRNAPKISVIGQR